MNENQKTTAEKMKLLRGKHTYKNYSELCEALCLTPAKRGKDRAEQKAAIAQQYRIEEHKNGSYTIEKINQETRREMKRQEKRENGVIVEIDGHEVDLSANLCYKHTMIDKYIDYTIFRLAKRAEENGLGTYDDSLTSMTNIWCCVFSRTKMYKELLKNIGTEGYNAFPQESLRYFNDVIMSLLYVKVGTRLKYLEKHGWITVKTMYRIGRRGDPNCEYVDKTEVQPSIDYALKKLRLKTEGQAMGQKRQEFIDCRNNHFMEATQKKLGAKVLEISSNIPELPNDDNGRPCTELSSRDVQIILTAFFDVFRARQLKMVDDKVDKESGKEVAGFRGNQDTKSGLVTLKNVAKTKELISTYCAYATTAGWAVNDKSSSDTVAFYSLDDLVEYYELNLNDPVLTVDFSDLVKCKTYTCDWDTPEEQQAEQFMCANWDMTDEDDIPEFDHELLVRPRYYAIENYLNQDIDDVQFDYDDF